MALTVETGEGLINATSYVTLAEVRAFATSRGKTVPVDDAELEAQVVLAHDYLLQYESRFIGWRYRGPVQSLAFPREGMVLHYHLLSYAVIPEAIKNAVCQLVLEQQEREDLQPVFEGRIATTETVGPISTTYQIFSASTSYPKVEAFLSPFLKTGNFSLTSARV